MLYFRPGSAQLYAVLRLKGAEYADHGLIGVGIGEGLVLGAQGEGEADALLALGDIRALVDVKDFDALQVLAPAFLMHLASSPAVSASSQTTEMSRMTAGKRGSGV